MYGKFVIATAMALSAMAQAGILFEESFSGTTMGTDNFTGTSNGSYVQTPHFQDNATIAQDGTDVVAGLDYGNLTGIGRTVSGNSVFNDLATRHNRFSRQGQGLDISEGSTVYFSALVTGTKRANFGFFNHNGGASTDNWEDQLAIGLNTQMAGGYDSNRAATFDGLWYDGTTLQRDGEISVADDSTGSRLLLGRIVNNAGGGDVIEFHVVDNQSGLAIGDTFATSDLDGGGSDALFFSGSYEFGGNVSLADFNFALQNNSGIDEIILATAYAEVLYGDLAAVLPPQDLVAAATGDAEVTLSWSVGRNAESYNVYRSLGSGTYGAALTNVGPGSLTSFEDRSVVNFSTYYYQMTSVSNGIESDPTAETSVYAFDPAATTAPRPNIIVVLLDDMGWSDLGCYGGEARTPAIDSLAATGVRFRNFYNTSRCSPTRMSLLTGLYTQQVATDPAASLPNWKNDNNISIPELLRTTGYHTYMSGKWHLGTVAGRTPWDRGFQHTYGFGSSGAGVGGDKWVDAGVVTSENNEIAALTYGSGPYDYYQPDACMDHVLDFVDHHVGKADGHPFFMYLPFYSPHFDLQVSMSLATNALSGEPSYLDIYSQGWDVVRSNRYARMVSMGIIDPAKSPLTPKGDCPYNANFTDPTQPIPDWDSLPADRKADLSLRMSLYTAMIDKVDQNIARLLDKLDAEALLDDTLIILLSDNGGNAEGGMFGRTFGTNNHAPLTGTDLQNMGQPGRNDQLWLGGGWANVADTPLRYFKRYSHEGGIRTPLIAHWPNGIVNPGRWTGQTGHLVDILATAADLSGAPYPTSYLGRTVLPMEGQSLAPVFRNDPVFDREFGFEHESCRAYIEGKWKFVTKTLTSTDGTSPADSFELYDLDADPVELNNLAADEPDKLVELIGKWNGWAKRVGVDAARWLPSDQTIPSASGTDLFLDTFSRLYATDVDADTSGMSGSRLAAMGPGAVYYEGFEGSGLPDSIQVLNNRLRISNGNGMAENGIMHNFIGQDIIDTGGFSVEMRIHALNTTTAQSSDRYVGFGVGLTQSEAAAGSDIANPDSFRGSVANPIGKCDFFVDLDIDQNIKVWIKGQLLETIPAPSATGTLTAAFSLGGFNAGSAVEASVFFNGTQLDINSGHAGSLTQTFTWENSNANHVGMGARTTAYADIDNFAVRHLPLSGALATGYATRSGLSGSDSALDADPDGDGNANLGEFAIGSNPSVADADVKAIQSVDLTTNAWQLDLRRYINHAAIGLDYQTQCSTNLASGTWTIVPYAEHASTPVTNSPEYEIVRIEVPGSIVAANSNLFVRETYQ